MKQRKISIKVNGLEKSVELPDAALPLLNEVIHCIAEGRSLTLLPSATEVTTQQAAGLLNMSRPHVVKLLELGEIPYRKAGRYRRILIGDINAYAERIKEEQKKQLSFLARQAQELNMGY